MYASSTSTDPQPSHRRDDADGAELERMEKEIEALRIEKDRVRQLADMEARERELSRRIVERELRRQEATFTPSLDI